MDIVERTTVETHTAHARDWFRNYMRNVKSMVENPPIDALKGRFRDVTAVIVGAGPSLAKNISSLRSPSVRSRVLVLAAATAYKPMVAAGVHPDVVLASEKVDMSEYFGTPCDSSVRLFINEDSHPSLHFDQPCKERYIIYNQDSALNKRLARHFGAEIRVCRGGNVVTQAMDAVMQMDIRKIILIGCDHAYGPDFRSHVAGGVYHEREGLLVDDTVISGGWYGPEQMSYASQQKIHWLLRAQEGFEGEKVASRPDWASFHAWTEKWLQVQKDSGLRAINATEGGALIKGMEHMGFEAALRSMAGPDARIPIPQDWPGRVHTYGERDDEAYRRGMRVNELYVMEENLKAVDRLARKQLEPGVDIKAVEQLLQPLIDKADFMREALPQIERDFETLKESDRIFDIMKLRNMEIIGFCSEMIPEVKRARKEMEEYG